MQETGLIRYVGRHGMVFFPVDAFKVLESVW